MPTSRIRTLAITSAKGVGLSFDNGFTLSIQVGPGNYCDNYDMDIHDFHTGPQLPRLASATAEMAIIDPQGELIEWPGGSGDTVAGYLPVSEIPEWIEYTANLTHP